MALFTLLVPVYAVFASFFFPHLISMLNPNILINPFGCNIFLFMNGLVILTICWQAYSNAGKLSRQPRFLGWATAATLLAYILGLFKLLLVLGSGMSWGRPLRIRGRIVQPELKNGTDWCQGEVPNPEDMDLKSRLALEALWLHDAKKEYASVPAFARLTWQLIALGAPSDLIRDLHLAGLQEIDHTKKCFALASGFGSGPQTITPMFEILSDFDNIKGEPFSFLAVDSLIDGCLLEGFNADSAEACALICQDPVSLKVIRQIAREERFHAELSWRVLEFCLSQNPHQVRQALLEAVATLSQTERPTAASAQNQKLLDEANPQILQRFGRITDEKLAEIWPKRLSETKYRLATLLSKESGENFSRISQTAGAKFDFPQL